VQQHLEITHPSYVFSSRVKQAPTTQNEVFPRVFLEVLEPKSMEDQINKGGFAVCIVHESCVCAMRTANDKQ
jgi:hypothetical protein